MKSSGFKLLLCLAIVNTMATNALAADRRSNQAGLGAHKLFGWLERGLNASN
ncbi:MAG: hypothetical protein ACREGC_01940 [Minisyncoccia bacterium]